MSVYDFFVIFAKALACVLSLNHTALLKLPTEKWLVQPTSAHAASVQMIRRVLEKKKAHPQLQIGGPEPLTGLCKVFNLKIQYRIHLWDVFNSYDRWSLAISRHLWAAHIVSQQWKTSRSLKGNAHPDSKQMKINLIRLHLHLTFKVLHYKLSHWVWYTLSVKAGGYQRHKWGGGKPALFSVTWRSLAHR